MKYYTGFCLETTFVALLSVKFLGLKLLLCNEQIWGLTVLQKCHHHKQYLFLYDSVTLKGGPWRMVSNIFFVASLSSSPPPQITFTHLFHSTILQNSSYSVALAFFCSSHGFGSFVGPGLIWMILCSECLDWVFRPFITFCIHDFGNTFVHLEW